MLNTLLKKKEKKIDINIFVLAFGNKLKVNFRS